MLNFRPFRKLSSDFALDLPSLLLALWVSNFTDLTWSTSKFWKWRYVGDYTYFVTEISPGVLPNLFFLPFFLFLLPDILNFFILMSKERNFDTFLKSRNLMHFFSLSAQPTIRQISDHVWTVTNENSATDYYESFQRTQKHYYSVPVFEPTLREVLL